MDPSRSPALELVRRTSIRWRPFRLPMRHRFEAAHGALADREGVLLELAAADGVTGMGEASPMASIGGGTMADVLALLEAHAAALLRSGDPLDVLPLVGPGVAALRCAVDVALLDLEGHRRGMPIARLLAADAPDDVAVNAIIGGGTPAEVAANALEARAAGYSVVKLKVGIGSVEEDVARVRAVGDAWPRAIIRLDANGAWSEATAREALEALEGLEVELLEQPVPAADVEALGRLTRVTAIPLGADEALRDVSTRQAVLGARAAEVLELKPMVVGGLREALDIAREGAGLGMRALATTTFDSSVGTAAALHLAAALRAVAPGSELAHGLGTGEHLAGDLVTPTLVATSGRMRVPLGGGLGIEVDTDALERRALGPWRNLSA
ncbi:MAG: enolase C-terminal domain-like protein [Dehalococcoidia bacterium]